MVTLLCNNYQLASLLFIIYILSFFLFQDSKSVSGGNSQSTKQDKGENTEIVKKCLRRKSERWKKWEVCQGKGEAR